MRQPEMTFAIPTYRLRDVAETIEKYDENFSRNGHALDVVVFDDSGENLSRAFYGFEPDFFQQNVSRIVDDVVSQIQASLELWPTLIEICYYHKDKQEFPRVRVKNKRVKTKMQAAA
jgi:hypothetical protein